MARRRRSRLRPALVILGLELAVTPLVWPNGGGPVDRFVELVVEAVDASP